MREEYGLEVLEKYNIEVKGTRKIRGAFFCDTNEGTMLLKETRISDRRALLLYRILNLLEMRGNVKVDTPVFTSEGELLVTSREGITYMLKKWYQGRECDIRQESEVIRAARQLALLHRELDEVSEDLAGDQADGAPACEIMNVPKGNSPLEMISRHNRELKKVRTFIRSRVTKNEFEYLFLDSFDKMYGMAEKVLRKMADSGCGRLYEDSISGSKLVHGDYNYHNLLILKEGMAVTGFERMRADIQVNDLYYFIRKVMEKHHWKLKSGQKLIEAYEAVRPLEPGEREYLGLSLAYPEKFWKTAGNYYRSNKAWIPEKCVEKLEIAVRQCEEKYEFLKEIFSLKM